MLHLCGSQCYIENLMMVFIAWVLIFNLKVLQPVECIFDPKIKGAYILYFLQFQGEVNCVKWDPTGSLLASCSDDISAKVIICATFFCHL